MHEDRSTGSLWPRLVVRVFVYDLINTLCAGYFWVEVIGAADVRVLAGLMLVRIAATYVWASMLFEPARRFEQRSGDVDDQELLSLDASIHHARGRLVTGYVAGWLLTLLGSTAALLLGIPVGKTLGLTELLTSVLVAVGLALAVAPVLSALIESASSETRATLGAMLTERKLGAMRPRTTIATSMLALHLSATLGIFIGVTGIGGMIRVQGIRAVELAEQQRRAELGAVTLRLSNDPVDDPELRVVARDELPASLLGSADPGGATTLAALDLAHGEALAAASVGDGRWVLAQHPTDEDLGPFIAFLVVLPLVIASTLAAANLIMSRSLATKLRELRSATRRVVEDGEIASIDRVVALDNDEIGLLVHDFNGMLDVFEELAGAAQKVAAGDLRVDLERPGDLHDAFRSMVARLDEMVVEIRSTAVELATAATQIHAVTRAQEQAAEQQSASVREVGASAASLANAAKEIAVTAGLVLENADRSLITTDLMIGKIAELDGEANGVADLLETIREVADRSDLLALNGSLEATRAGEAGRGFALVAAEMRRLAERVNGAVTDVRKRVTSIERAGTSTVLATEEAKQLAERTAGAAEQISAVTSQQSRDTQQVSQAIEDATQGAIAAAAATAQTRVAAQQLEGKVERLEQLTRRFQLRSSTG